MLLHGTGEGALARIPNAAGRGHDRRTGGRDRSHGHRGADSVLQGAHALAVELVVVPLRGTGGVGAGPDGAVTVVGVGDREVDGGDLPHPVAGVVAVDGGDAPTVLDRCHAAQRVVSTGRLSQRRWRLFRTGPAGPAPATSGGSEEPPWCHSGKAPVRARRSARSRVSQRRGRRGSLCAGEHPGRCRRA